MPRTTARQHVMNALMEMREEEDSARRKAEDMLEYFRLPRELWDLYPNTFSGGERLRLNLAHTMVKQPRLMLLDEATASCIYTQKGNKKIRKPQAANQTALIFDRRAAARLLSINSIRRLCWS